MAKMLVPALTLPVRCETELVATMPVPASPSGGQRGIPACRVPDGSSRAAPASVSCPAASPARRMVGSRSASRSFSPRSAVSSSNRSSIRWS